MGPLSNLIDTAKGPGGIAFFRKVKGRRGVGERGELCVVSLYREEVWCLSVTTPGARRGDVVVEALRARMAVSLNRALV